MTDAARDGVIAAQDRLLEQLDATRTQRQARFVATAAHRPKPRGARLWLAAGGALAAAALAVLWLGRTSPPQPEPLAPLVNAPRELNLNNGALLRLDATARVEVAFDVESLARVRIDEGVVHVESPADRDATSSVSAGPFEISSTRADLSVQWDPRTQALDVSVERGEAVITQISVGTRQVVVAGDAVRVHATVPEVEVTKIEAPPAPGEATKAKKRRAPGWEDLARQGKHAEALAAAESEGFERTCRRASVTSLRALADAARYAGKPSRARFAFETLRKRFPSSAAASRAAYALGRLAFDSQRDYKAAARWFSTYLAERPRGALAREALGRLLESQWRSGARGEAKATATKYLDKYPGGPHGDIARKAAGR